MVRAGLTVAAEDAAPVYIRDRVALTVDERRALKAARSAPAEQP
jgi:tRNA threonylcarbamoyladenosine biosynthesis protein TsaB